MKIVVMTDLHANFPALRAALEAIKRDGYDIIVHTGDAIAIGPYPAECLDLLLNTRNIRLIMGNHESYYVGGLPNPQSSGMSDGEVLHQIWTHAQLDPDLRKVVAQWPYRMDLEDCGINAAFMHYALDASGRDFARIRLVQPPVADLEAAFSSISPQVVFCGHEHSPFDVQGRTRYVNPGALGCSKDPLARYATLEIAAGQFHVVHHAVEYDRADLFRAFAERDVPDREFIGRVFFGKTGQESGTDEHRASDFVWS